MSDQGEIDEYYNLVYLLVTEAGQILREGYYGKKKYETKSAFYDLVTEYDTRIEDHLINGISKKYPNHKFIGEEETAKKSIESELTDAPTWIIDAIDGTTNFIKKIPHACISIALTINKQLVIGIVYNPIANEIFTARKGQGAFMNGDKISVSDVDKVNDAVVGFEISLIHAKAVRDRFLKRLWKIGSNARGTRTLGSAALTLCYVANGSLDCYHVEALKPWDCAAGALIAQEAGGIVCHTTGKEFDVMKPDLICCTNAKLAKEIMGFIEEADKRTDFQMD